MQIQPFQIIPVIDLMYGQVVHAKLGQRNDYKPITSQLCTSSNAIDIVNALLKLYPFRTLYIADIDAILGRENHNPLIEKIHLDFPKLNIWLDTGSPQTNCNTIPVLGSESISNLQSYLEYKNPHILSLDYNAQGTIGLNVLHETTNYWPNEIICMTLNAVGSLHGADYARLERLSKLNAQKEKPSRIYAAGGVRNMDDVKTLDSMGLSGVLLASALHNGNITHEEIVQFYAQ